MKYYKLHHKNKVYATINLLTPHLSSESPQNKKFLELKVNL